MPGSITAKNLCIFLPIFLAALAPLAYTYRQDVKASRIANLATQLELIAEQSAKRIDPVLVGALSREEDSGSAAHARLVAVLEGIQTEFQVDNAVLMRRLPSGRFEFIADGSDQFHVTQPVFIHDAFPETFSAAMRAWERRGRASTQLFGFGTFEYLQFHKPVESGGQVVALLMLNRFAEEVDQAIKRDTLKLALLTLGILLVGSAVFWGFSTRLLRPVVAVHRAADRVAAGDWSVSVAPVAGTDEVARLNQSFRTMVRQLRRGREQLEHKNAELSRTLARVQLMEDLEKSLLKLVPRAARTALHADPGALERGKTERDVTVLFLDVEGSARLTEALSPERLDHVIQNYFSQYLDCIYENSGDITETAGDGLMILFQNDIPEQHAWNAVRTALAIQTATERIRRAGITHETDLRINIGISSGPALVGFTRYEAISGERVTFTAGGRTTIVAARLQHMATGGSVLASAETLQRVRAHPAGGELGLRATDQGAVSLKNLNQPEQVYRLDAAEAPAPSS